MSKKSFKIDIKTVNGAKEKDETNTILEADSK